MIESEQLQGYLPRIAQGDRQAFKAFYDATAPALYAIGIRMLGSRVRADDLLQDVYLRVWYRAADYHPGRGSARVWLVAIARNRAIDLRRQAFERGEPLRDDAQELADDTRDVLDGDAGRLADCFDQLVEDQRQSLYSAFFGGLSHSEIAARFREPLGTIKSRIRRGLASLRECLDA